MSVAARVNGFERRLVAETDAALPDVVAMACVKPICRGNEIRPSRSQRFGRDLFQTRSSVNCAPCVASHCDTEGRAPHAHAGHFQPGHLMPISFSSPATRDGRARGAGVTAVLGPTNTGKTHLAIERMLGHSSGMIGLPLRLLAREVYNKVVDRVGAENVALDHRRREDQAAQPALLGRDRRGHAARPRPRVRRHRRSAARRRSRSRPRLHRPHAQPPRARGDAGARRRHRAADGRAAACAAPTSCSGRGCRR